MREGGWSFGIVLGLGLLVALPGATAKGGDDPLGPGFCHTDDYQVDCWNLHRHVLGILVQAVGEREETMEETEAHAATLIAPAEESVEGSHAFPAPVLPSVDSTPAVEAMGAVLDMAAELSPGPRSLGSSPETAVPALPEFGATRDDATTAPSPTPNSPYPPSQTEPGAIGAPPVAPGARETRQAAAAEWSPVTRDPVAPAADPPVAPAGESAPRALHTATAREHLVPGVPIREESRLLAAFLLTVVLTVASLLLRALPLYTRLTPERLLANPVRRALLAHVRNEPGTTCAEAARAAGVSFTTARRHLRFLARFGHVSPVTVNRRTRYFPEGSPWPLKARPAVALLRQVQNARFLHEVARSPGVTLADVARRLGIAKSTASRRAALLREAGLLKTTERGLDVGDALRSVPR